MCVMCVCVCVCVCVSLFYARRDSNLWQRRDGVLAHSSPHVALQGQRHVRVNDKVVVNDRVVDRSRTRRVLIVGLGADPRSRTPRVRACQHATEQLHVKANTTERVDIIE